MKKYVVLFLLAFSFFGFGVQQVHAESIGEKYTDIQNQGIIFAGICSGADEDCACRDAGDCTLQDMLQLLVNFSVFILAISGSVLLFVIVYGGMQWILAHGNPTWVENGKKTLVGGVVGLVIIMGAYTAINVLVSILKTGDVTTTDIETTVGDGASDVINTQ